VPGFFYPGKIMALDLNDYFSRINYQGPTTPSLATLQGIHAAHVSAIAFENLSIQMLQPAKDLCPIRLDEEALIEKLIHQRRGGYCFETNELLALALEALGFSVQRLFARVITAGAPRPLSHKLLLIDIDAQPWIADVGFGNNGLTQAIPLQPDQTFAGKPDPFKLRKERELYTLSVQIHAHWLDLYAFNTTAYLPIDYAPANYYTATMPDSKFVQNRICTRPTEDGRITLLNNRLKIRENQHTEVRTVVEEEILPLLEHYFGIILPAATRFRLPGI
jgi:N-hydroxyarylamine O-acetyltransferase